MQPSKFAEAVFGKSAAEMYVYMIILVILVYWVFIRLFLFRGYLEDRVEVQGSFISQEEKDTRLKQIKRKFRIRVIVFILLGLLSEWAIYDIMYGNSFDILFSLE